MDYEDLVAIQMKEYPSSEILNPTQVLRWCFDAPNSHARELRMSATVMTLQAPGGVWYRFKNHPSAVMGYRYGPEPHAYMSGFSDI